MLQVSFSFNYFNELFNCARETSKMSSTITLYYVMDWVSNHFIMHCLSTSLCITWNEWTGEQYLPSDMERCLTRYSSVYTPVIMYVLYDLPCAEKDVKPRYTIQHNAMQRDATWHDGTQHNAAHATQHTQRNTMQRNKWSQQSTYIWNQYTIIRKQRVCLIFIPAEHGYVRYGCIVDRVYYLSYIMEMVKWVYRIAILMTYT